MADYVMIKAETAIGTFVTPTVTLPVESWTSSLGQSRMMKRETGATRGVSLADEGAYKPSGSFTLFVTPELIPYVIKAAGFNSATKSTPGGATNTRDHVFQQDDSAALKSLSVQLLQIRNGTTVATNIRGLIINRLTLTLAAEQWAKITCDYFAYEECKAGGTFSDGNSSPAAQSPSTPTPVQSFSFKSAAAQYGGTAAQDGTTKIITISTGTAVSNVQSFEVTIDNGLSQAVFLNNLYTAKIHAGERSVSFKATIDNDTPALTYYDFVTGVTQHPWDIVLDNLVEIESGFNYEMQITLPKVDYTKAEFGEVNSSVGMRTFDVEGMGLIHPTIAKDIILRLRDDNDTGY